MFADGAGGLVEPLAVMRQFDNFGGAEILVCVGCGFAQWFEQASLHEQGDFAG